MSPSQFEDRRPLPNPFGRIVGHPLEDDEIDVAEINRPAFEACQLLVEDVRRQHASAALTLFGEAGAGKTHLLGRVRRWLQNMPGNLFVLVRMDTNARMLWRHLRRCLADALLRSSSSGGGRIIDDLLRERRAEVAHLPERDLSIVLEHCLSGTHPRDATAWLRGQELPEAAVQRLEVAQPGPEENQEAASRSVVVSLCSLIEPGAVVFCLDQLEALQNLVDDADGLRAAGQAISLLHDMVRNACVICCVQTGFLQTIEKILDEATRHRMLGRRQAIHLIDWEQAQRLIAARLKSIPALMQQRQANDSPLWPLSDDPIRQVFVDNAAPARRVISRCKDLFDQWRTGELPAEEPLDAALQSMLDERMAPVDPAEAEAVFRDGLPLLLSTLAGPVVISPSRSPFDFLLAGGKQTIAICNQVNGISLATRIRKVGDAWKPAAGQRLMLLRDSRLLISPNAKATQQRLQALSERGGFLVPVSQEAIESLAALRRLLADAKSGDLAYRGEPIPAGNVQNWITSHLPAALDPLIDELETGTPNALTAKLAALLAQRKLISLADAARELETRFEEVETCARRDPRLFGVLGGATPALFQPIHAE
jgi:hypothetical protein